MKKLCYLFLAIIYSIGYAQEKIELKVYDLQKIEPIPFAKVSVNKSNAQYTNIDGIVKISAKPEDSIYFSFYDFEPLVLSYQQIPKDSIIFLAPQTQSFDEVEVYAGENSAHRIIRNALNNKKANDPLKNDAFTYKSYSKFFITGETDVVFDKDTLQDTSLIEMLDLLEKQYLFLTETSAERTFSPPSYDQEEILSYRVSGIKNPLFATLVSQLQSFSFYDNTFEINGKAYINPIAPGTFNRYLFLIQDTLITPANDSVFTISYQPRKGKNFEGLKGYLFITTKDWALQRVIAEPFEQSISFKLKTIQEYKYTADKKWFPYEISTEIDFTSVQIGDGGHRLVGKSNLYISDVQFEKPSRKRFNAISVSVRDGAEEDSITLKTARNSEYTSKEYETYKIIDSIAEAENFERYMEIFEILSSGVIPIKKIGIPLKHIYNFNLQEGSRLGLGLYTNERMSKYFKVGGYFAYGFRDKSWKWGGDLDLTPFENKNTKFQFIYKDDLLQRGGEYFNNNDFSLINEAVQRDFFINEMDRVRKAEFAFSFLPQQNMNLRVFANYNRFTFFDNYEFMPSAGGSPATSNQFDVAETGFLYTWNIREKVMLLGNQRISLGTKYPKITLRAVKGWDNIFEGDYDYYRLNMTIDQSFQIRGFGKLQLQASGGSTIGDVPVTLLQNAPGTGRNWNLVVPNSFETMRPAEFFSTHQAALFSRLTFLPIKSKLNWTEPLISIHNAAGVGFFDNDRSAHVNHNFLTHEKGYFESGLIVDNLLISGFNGFGLGIFHRYGPYALPSLSDNFFYKISVKFNL